LSKNGDPDEIIARLIQSYQVPMDRIIHALELVDNTVKEINRGWSPEDDLPLIDPAIKEEHFLMHTPFIGCVPIMRGEIVN
jgi:hypothetical protein